MKDYSVQIESYLTGELNHAETADFEMALRSDPDLAFLVSQFRELQSQLEGMRIRKKVGAVLMNRQKETGFGKKGWIWIFFAAALCVLLAYFFLPKSSSAPQLPVPPPTTVPPIQQNTPPQAERQTPSVDERSKTPKSTTPDLSKSLALAREFYAPATANLVREVVESDAPDTRLQEAAVLYSEGKYQLACDLMKSDSILGAGENGRFLRANARFKAGLFRGALSDFKQLENSFKYRYEAQWNGLLCEIALGNAEKTSVKSALGRIIADPDHPFYDNAIALKKSL